MYRLRPERPSLERFSEWLKVQVGVLSYTAPPPAASERRHLASKPRDGTAARKFAFVTGATCSEDVESRPGCAVCKAAHKLVDCPAFKAKTTSDKMDVAISERLCFSCLKKGHWSRKCKAARRCGIDDCRYKHHALLHDSKRHAEADKDAPRKEEGVDNRPFVVASARNGTNTLLQIVAIRVHGDHGAKDVLAMSDSGAHRIFVRGGMTSEGAPPFQKGPNLTYTQNLKTQRISVTLFPRGPILGKK